jgi:phosphohistidine phosphatase SixA
MKSYSAGTAIGMELTDMPTVLAVRHADIDLPPVDNDPSLNPAGRQRARELARLVGPAGITAILISEFTRTQQTVEPIAHNLGLEPQIGPSPTVLAAQVRAGELGDFVLVAGHSNTIPEIIAALGSAVPPPITEAEFDNLYVIAVVGAAAQLLHLRYGTP